jgi:hypothetical protein
LNKQEIVRAIRDERRRTLTFLQGLEPTQFDTPTALPAWRIREVIAHLITTDKASVTGANLIAVLGSMDRLERWNEGGVPKWANRPIPELMMGLDRWGRSLAGDLVISLEGAPVPEWRYDLAARTGAAVDGPTEVSAVRLAAPANRFIMAAAGRDSFDALRRDGALEVEGDPDLATRFLACLRVV